MDRDTEDEVGVIMRKGDHPQKTIKLKTREGERECEVDEKVAELVKELNEFTDEDGRHPFVTVMSCQEKPVAEGWIGGKVWVNLKPFYRPEKDVFTLLKVMNEAFKTSIRDGTPGMMCRNSRVSLEVGMHPKRKNVDYIPMIELDCSKHDYGRGNEREEFEKSRDDAIKHIVGVLRWLNSGE